MKFFKLLNSVLWLAVIAMTSVWAADAPILTIQTPSQTVTFTHQQLLAKAEELPQQIFHDPAYKKESSTYTVVAIHKLFEGLTVLPEQVVQFKCLDGFSGPINQQRLLNTDPNQAIAYLAIEPLNKKWPPLKAGKSATAGPFYLVWKNASLSQVGPEEWPYQLAGFEVKKSLRETFPDIFPSNSVAEDHSIQNGFKVFTKNCFACHTLNRNGEAKMGPDLNVPNNPTEYLKVDYIKTLIRNPQDLRYWPNSSMPSFSERIISNDDLSDLLNYLKHMSGNKVTTPK